MANEKRLIDANAKNADSCETAKIKTHFAKIIVEGTAKHPYYGIMFFNPTDGEYHVGFGSYYIGNVFQWLSEEFEIVAAPTAERRMIVTNCKDCKTNCVYRGKDNEARCGSFVGTVTNADRIRAMSDEELATDLLDMFQDICEDGVPSKEWMLEWLKQPAEERQ